MHTPRHFFREQGGHVGEHGSLDVIQRQGVIVLSGEGVEARGMADEHASLVDVGPTLAALPVSPTPTCATPQFLSITLTNHTSILTGLGPGRHGFLGNVFYDRATGEQVVPNGASTWQRSAEWLRLAVRTVFEMVTDLLPREDSPRTACINEALDRGADYSTMAVIRESESTSGAAGLDDLLPDARSSVYVHDKAHLEDSYFSWATQVDDLGLVTGVVPGPPRRARDHRPGDASVDRRPRFRGVRRRRHRLMGPALENLGIPFHNEGPGFIYLLPDERQT